MMRHLQNGTGTYVTLYLCDTGKLDYQNKNTMQFHFREVTHII